MATHDQEELLNGKLAELLRGQGLDARAERRESGRRMDIVADIGGARVVLEAEAGFSEGHRAQREVVPERFGEFDDSSLVQGRSRAGDNPHLVAHLRVVTGTSPER